MSTLGIAPTQCGQIIGLLFIVNLEYTNTVLENSELCHLHIGFPKQNGS